MSSLTRLLLAVACAALLQVGCEARRHNRRHSHRRNEGDTAVVLGNVTGSNIQVLPPITVNGPDLILGLPDNCAPDELLGTLIIVSNSNGSPPDVSPDDNDDPQSNVAIDCVVEDDGSRCPGGLTINTYQFCG